MLAGKLTGTAAVIKFSRFEAAHIMTGIAGRFGAAVFILVTNGAFTLLLELSAVAMAIPTDEPLVTALCGGFMI